jgi:hypothetical protein
MKKKSGISTVLLDEKERQIINDNGATLKGVVKVGLMVLEGTLPKINKLAEKLAESLQEKAILEQELKKFKKLYYVDCNKGN